ncbi:hypothetical protein [Nitrosomonas ureae]|uniref:DUF4435 domain-containing protein n=1 Tax=Nitrosomonas ureae TaxID=44577 RepID=A0A2T5ITX8_9PROT|nr:hypothetical protein [Nitrosomonas ureae]PTQ87263.1 hypothetical protein C8R28_100623 [Nitrosomonas ureae]
MPSFKKVQAEFVDDKYEGGTKVFLESAEDVRIFSDHWFSDKQDKLRFVSAEGDQSGGGGCQVVISKVNEANAHDIKAYGIVDRDVLLADKKLDLFWETDDTRFHATQPYGDKIYVLRRWELENYLLQPEAFSTEVSKRISRSPVPNISAQTLLDQSEDIIKVTALTTISVANGKASPNPGFGSQSSGQDLNTEIEKYLKHQFPDDNYPEIDGDSSRIRTFDQPSGSSEERWDRLSRILDGKKSLMRLCHHFSESLQISSIRSWEEMRGCLANVIASKGAIDTELIHYINSLDNV